MAENTNLCMYLIRTLQPECQSRESYRSKSEEIQNLDLDNLIRDLDKAGNYPREICSFFQCTTIIKAEEHPDLLGNEKTKKIVDCYLSLCQSRKLEISDYISHINSIMVREILAADTLNQVFEFGKISLLLKNYNLDLQMIESSLEIAFSPFIFEMALGTEKQGIIEALKGLIKANDLNLDSTGANHAIIENALSWVEDNEDYYKLKESQGQHVNPDKEGSQIINGLLLKIEPNDQDFKERIESLKNRYGFIEVFDNYREDYYAEDTLNHDTNNSKNIDEITSIDQIKMNTNPIRTTCTDNKKIYTHIYEGLIKANNLKICVKKISVTDINDLKKFQHEVNTMRLLSGRHECFLKFYGAFIIENELFIVMEFIENNLMDVMTRGNLTQLQQIEIAKKLIAGFSYLSQLKIYHRDIKPHNILMTPTFEPKIIDFGISYFDLNPSLANDTSLTTNSKYVQGTLGYMSPEQKLAFEQYKKKEPIIKYAPLLSDVFSLGITFFQMATGRDVRRYEDKNTNDELLNEVNKLASVELRNIIIKMVDKEPSKRLTFFELLGIIEKKTYTIIN